jgi:hypothetical protein
MVNDGPTAKKTELKMKGNKKNGRGYQQELINIFKVGVQFQTIKTETPTPTSPSGTACKRRFFISPGWIILSHLIAYLVSVTISISI